MSAPAALPSPLSDAGADPRELKHGVDAAPAHPPALDATPSAATLVAAAFSEDDAEEMAALAAQVDRLRSAEEQLALALELELDLALEMAGEPATAEKAQEIANDEDIAGADVVVEHAGALSALAAVVPPATVEELLRGPLAAATAAVKRGLAVTHDAVFEFPQLELEFPEAVAHADLVALCELQAMHAAQQRALGSDPQPLRMIVRESAFCFRTQFERLSALLLAQQAQGDKEETECVDNEDMGAGLDLGEDETRLLGDDQVGFLAVSGDFASEPAGKRKEPADQEPEDAAAAKRARA